MTTSTLHTRTDAQRRSSHTRAGWIVRRTIPISLLLILLAGCAAPPEANVLGYLLARHLGTLTPDPTAATGAITGIVRDDAGPFAGATVVVATRIGQSFTATSDAQGRYTLTGVPVGQYVPAAVAPGYEETIATDILGIPRLVTVKAAQTAQAPVLTLTPHTAQPLPDNVPLTLIATYTATAPFPAGAASQVSAFAFEHAGATIDSLRLYLPMELRAPRLPMLFMVYPTEADTWEPVSVGFAAAGYALVAVSPIGARGVDINAHAQDARVAFQLARQGRLHPAVAADEAILLGGSFSSPVLHRFLRDEYAHVTAWVTVGGISNGFDMAADFYAGRVQIPPPYELAIPALGAPNVRPLLFLRYSPVFTAAQLPPTLIVHTPADTITPIGQAYQLEAALRAAGVPVETFYYEDVHHNIQIGADLTDAGKEMYDRVLNLARRHQSLPPQP